MLLWDAHTRRPLGAALVGHQSAVQALAFSPDSATLASAGADSSLRIWDARRGAPLAEPGAAPPGTVVGATLSSDGRVLATGRRDGGIAFWDAISGQPLVSRPGAGSEVVDLSLSADGGTGAVISADGTVRVWDTRTGDARGPGLRHRSGPRSVTLSPDGRSVVTTGDQPPFQLADVNGRRTTPATTRLPGFGAAFRHDGVQLAAGLLGGPIELWDVGARRAARPLRGNGAESIALAFDDGGLLLAAGDPLGRIVLWDLPSGRSLAAPLKIHSGEILALTFIGDAQTVATAGADRTVSLVDVTAGRRLGPPLTGHNAAVHAVAVTARGQLMSADASGRVLLWDRLLLSTDERAWRNRICRLVGRSMTREEWTALLPDRPYRAACRG